MLLPCTLTLNRDWRSRPCSPQSTGIIHAFRPKANPIHLPMESSEPSDLYAASPPQSPPPVQKQPKKQERHSPAFDLTLARMSLFVEIVVYALVPFASTGSGFMAAVAAGSLGAGFAPTMQSLALELYQRRGGKESGKVFGALSLVHAARYAALLPPSSPLRIHGGSITRPTRACACASSVRTLWVLRCSASYI